MMVALCCMATRAAVFVAADCEGPARTDDFVMIVALDPPDFPNHQRLPQAAFEGPRRPVPAGFEAVRGGRLVNSATSRWMHEDQANASKHKAMKLMSA